MAKLKICDQVLNVDPYPLIGACDYLQSPDRVQALTAGELTLEFRDVLPKYFHQLFDWHETVSADGDWTPPPDCAAGGVLLAAALMLLKRGLFQKLCTFVQLQIASGDCSALIDLLDHLLYVRDFLRIDEFVY